MSKGVSKTAKPSARARREAARILGGGRVYRQRVWIGCRCVACDIAHALDRAAERMHRKCERIARRWAEACVQPNAAQRVLGSIRALAPRAKLPAKRLTRGGGAE